MTAYKAFVNIDIMGQCGSMYDPTAVYYFAFHNGLFTDGQRVWNFYHNHYAHNDINNTTTSGFGGIITSHHLPQCVYIPG